MRLRSECVPAMALVLEHQHDLAHVIRNLAPLRRPPPVIARLAADLRSIAIEINQRHSFQDRNASDLQAALDIGEPRSGTTTKASFVPPPLYTPAPGPLAGEKPPPRSSMVASPTSPAIELIHKTPYAALADVLASTPRLHA